jgi:hypothetical protein
MTPQRNTLAAGHARRRYDRQPEPQVPQIDDDREGRAMGFLDGIKGAFAGKPEGPTPAELSRLQQLRLQIRDGIRGWVAAGEALREIRDKQLYRWSAPTFEQFAATEFKLTGRRLGQLIDAAMTWGDIATELPDAAAAGPPNTEKVMRELRQLPEQDRAPAYAEALAVATSTADEPTPPDTKTIVEVVRRRKAASGRKVTPKPLRFRVPGATVMIAWNAKGDGDAAAALQAALDQLSRSTSKAA